MTTEIKKLRLSYGVSVKELCHELNMATGLYSVHETGSRRYKEDRYEQFYFEVAHALERIVAKRKILSQQATTYRNEGLSIKDSKLHNLMVGEDDDSDLEELIYQPITEDLFKKAINLLAQGLNTIQISVKLDICELELEKKIGAVKADFSLDAVLEM